MGGVWWLRMMYVRVLLFLVFVLFVDVIRIGVLIGLDFWIVILYCGSLNFGWLLFLFNIFICWEREKFGFVKI